VQLGARPLRAVCRRAGCQHGVFGAVGGQQNLSWKALYTLNLLLDGTPEARVLAAFQAREDV
jgi:hypothetical protein